MVTVFAFCTQSKIPNFAAVRTVFPNGEFTKENHNTEFWNNQKTETKLAYCNYIDIVHTKQNKLQQCENRYIYCRVYQRKSRHRTLDNQNARIVLVHGDCIDKVSNGRHVNTVNTASDLYSSCVYCNYCVQIKLHL